METLKRIVLTFILLTGCCLTADANSWNADNTPMEHLKDAHRYLCDPEQLINAQNRDSIDHYLYALDKECGIESVFVIVNHVDNGDTFRYATEIGKKYGVGDKRTHRGLVVVVAVKDHRYFIATGKGLEADLTDAETDIIARRCIVPNMRNNHPDEAMLQTAKTLYKKFKTGKLDTTKATKQDENSGTIGFIIVIAAISIWWCWVYFHNDNDQHNNKGKGNRGGRRKTGSDIPFIVMGPGFMSGRHRGGGFGGTTGGSFGGGSFGGGGSGGSW